MFRYHPDGLTVREIKAMLKDIPELDPAGHENRIKVVTEQGIRNIVQSSATQSLVLLELGITRARADRRNRAFSSAQESQERRQPK